MVDGDVCGGGFTVAHKTVPMFCCLGQMDLMQSDDINIGSETFIMSPIYRTRSYTGGKGDAKLSGISHDGM